MNFILRAIIIIIFLLLAYELLSRTYKNIFVHEKFDQNLFNLYKNITDKENIWIDLHTYH